MRSNVNTSHIEGYLYEQTLEKKVTGAKIIESGKTWLDGGREEATKLTVNTALALNDFYAQDDTLVSQQRNEGGFVTIVNRLNEEKKRNTFEADMVITNVKTIEANEDRGIDEYISIRGCIFNFRNEILPIEFTVKSAAGIEYFNSIDISSSNPLYTKVWGNVLNKTIVTKKVEESGFGESKVIESSRNIREWVITGIAKEPYEWDDENTITTEELTKAIQDREIKLAETKKRHDDYKTNIVSIGKESSIIGNKIPTGKFNF
jgi:hypothetical protein